MTDSKIEISETRKTLAGMLTESTGRHFLDSGGAYGRHWEQNQGRDFESEPASSLDCRHGEISVTHNVYHWLAERLDVDEDLTASLHRFGTDHRSDEPWLVTMQDFPAYHAACVRRDEDPYDVRMRMGERYYEAAGIYGEGDPLVVNTYNGEDLLSQTIQFVYWELCDEAYVALQVHGGCDVRGGYTKPQVFRLNGDYGELSIFDNAKAHLWCSDDTCESTWYTDDGCNWYPDGVCGAGYTNLEDEPSIQLVDAEEFEAIQEDGCFHERDGAVLKVTRFRDAHRFPGRHQAKSTGGFSENVVASEARYATTWQEGYFCWDDDGNGFCPHCGGKLQASS